MILPLLLSLLAACDTTQAFVLTNPRLNICAQQPVTATQLRAHWMDYLKFNGATPDFDVIEKTKQYTNEPGYRAFNLKEIPTHYYSKDYNFNLKSNRSTDSNKSN